MIKRNNHFKKQIICQTFLLHLSHPTKAKKHFPFSLIRNSPFRRRLSSATQSPTSSNPLRPSITEMQDPRNHVPSSPTISSVSSSSDLDTESTGSFFHDRSITLGTLMGFSFTATMPLPFRASSQRHVSPSVAISRASSSNARRHQRKRPPSATAEPERHRRRKWWRFCRDDDEDAAGNGSHRSPGDCRRSSLGEYLEVERRFGDEAVYGSAETELEGAVARYRNQQPVLAEGALFADGRVLPPASTEAVTREGTPVASALCRFPVSLTGICSGGGG